MTIHIDEELDKAFTPHRVVQAFFEYKYAKWDRFSNFDAPEINIPMGADGVHAIAFEQQLNRHATNIARRIQEDSYLFYPFREVDKKKDKTLPLIPENTRILGTASIRDALVQSILYEDVLYEKVDALFSSLDSSTSVSFAYRKGKSAPKAAMTVHKYIKEGYTHVLDADLSKYFDKIPHRQLLEKVAQVIDGNTSRTYRLVRRFVNVDRVPHDTYKNIKRGTLNIGEKVFHFRKPLVDRDPKRVTREKGVPQGGVLSGLLANLYLHDFDIWVVQELSKDFDLKYLRYADDFIILLKSNEHIDELRDRVKQQLLSLELILNETKTVKIDVIKDGLDFVGFNFDGKWVRARSKNVEKFKDRIRDETDKPLKRISPTNDPKKTLKWLVSKVNYKIQGLSGKAACAKCGYNRIGPPRSWMAFFGVVTDISQLRNLDRWTRTFLYETLYKKHKIRLTRGELRNAGLKSLVHERWKFGKSRRMPCICDIETEGIWQFSKDLYQGNKIVTLVRKKRFLVIRVEADGLECLVSGKRNWIKRIHLEELWHRLLADGGFTRAQLEVEGYQSTSQIIALLERLPGVVSKLGPVRLQFEGKAPANFMIQKISGLP